MAVGLEADPGERRWRVDPEPRGGGGDGIEHELAHHGQWIAGEDGEAAFDLAPGWNRAEPVAAADLAAGELHRVLDMAEPGMALRPLVDARREGHEVGNVVIGGEDGAGAGLGLQHMNRLAENAQAEPDRAELGAKQLVLHRLGDQAGVGAVAALERRQRAVAGALLLAHRLDEHVARRGEAGVAERVEREHHGRDADLHVVGAAAMHEAVFDQRLERRMAPLLQRPRRHDVDMALKDEAASFRGPLAFFGRKRGHDLHGLGVVDIDDRRCARLALDRHLGDREAVDEAAACRELAGEPCLARRLVAARRIEGDQPRQPVGLALPVGVDRRRDGVPDGLR